MKQTISESYETFLACLNEQAGMPKLSLTELSNILRQPNSFTALIAGFNSDRIGYVVIKGQIIYLLKAGDNTVSYVNQNVDNDPFELIDALCSDIPFEQMVELSRSVEDILNTIGEVPIFKDRAATHKHYANHPYCTVIMAHLFSRFPVSTFKIANCALRLLKEKNKTRMEQIHDQLETA